MAGTTPQGPINVNTLINDLKLLPPKMKIQITNSDGIFYISDLVILDECTVELILTTIPGDCE